MLTSTQSIGMSRYWYIVHTVSLDLLVIDFSNKLPTMTNLIKHWETLSFRLSSYNSPGLGSLFQPKSKSKFGAWLRLCYTTVF